jgi:hypothetical protein
MWHICVLNDVTAPSSGISTALADVRVVRDLLRDVVDDLRATVAVEVRVEREVRPGMAGVFVVLASSLKSRVAVWAWKERWCLFVYAEGAKARAFPIRSECASQLCPANPGRWRHRPSCRCLSWAFDAWVKFISSQVHLQLFCSPRATMFQTASRRIAATALRRAESINVAQIEANYKVGLNVSRAQGVGQRGLLDGTSIQLPVAPIG